MANGNSLFSFLAGAAVGAAVVAYLKSDKEKLAETLDKIEDALLGLKDDVKKATEDISAEETPAEEEPATSEE